MCARTVKAPLDSIERFAAITAALAHAEDPEAVLRAAGLDAALWQILEARWIARCEADESDELAGRFLAAYEAALRAWEKPPAGVRLQRFDPQTGERVPVPYWVDGRGCFVRWPTVAELGGER